jgi:hypothetical protein
MRIKHSNHNVYNLLLNPRDRAYPAALQPFVTITMPRPIAYCAGRLINPRTTPTITTKRVPAWRNEHLQ